MRIRPEAKQEEKEMDKEKKKKQSALETEIFIFIERCMRKTLNSAIDSLLKDWK